MDDNDLWLSVSVLWIGVEINNDNIVVYLCIEL